MFYVYLAVLFSTWVLASDQVIHQSDRVINQEVKIPGSTAKITFLKTKQAVKEAYCSHEYYYVFKGSSCESDDMQRLKIELPKAYGDMIFKHVTQLWKQEAFAKLDLSDFFHGHLIVLGSKQGYASIEEVFSELTAIVYHTHENDNYWEDQAEEPEDKKQRSFVGWLDGRLESAINVVSQDNLRGRNYLFFGTIYSSDLVRQMPNLSRLNFNFGQVTMPQLHLTDAQTWGDTPFTCSPDSMFYVLPDKDGPYEIPELGRFAIYLFCQSDRRALDDPSK